VALHRFLVLLKARKPGRIFPNREQMRLGGRTVELAARDFLHDYCPSWAAAIAYYSLLSLFPLLLAVGSIAAYFVDARWAVEQATHYLGALLPNGTTAIDRIVRQTLSAARGGGLLSFFPLLWTGSLVFGAMTKALNIIFESRDYEKLWRRMLTRFAMLLGLGVMFLVALASPVVFQVLRWVFGILPIGRELLFQLVTNALPPVFILVAFFLSFRLVPTRHPDWRAALAGAIFGAVLFAIAKPLFLGYLYWLARYNVVYGSLAGIIVVMFWTWIVAMIGLFGAQVAAHANGVFVEGRSIEELARHRLRGESRRGAD